MTTMIVFAFKSLAATSFLLSVSNDFFTPYNVELFFLNMDTKGFFFQFEDIINVLVSSFRFI